MKDNMRKLKFRFVLIYDYYKMYVASLKEIHTFIDANPGVTVGIKTTFMVKNIKEFTPEDKKITLGR